MPLHSVPDTRSETPALPAELERPQLLELYRYLRLTRTLEERLVALYRQSKVIGGLFRSLGQEGESVASAYALERGRHRDVLSPLIRNLGSMLVMGAKPLEILRQYMAKAESPTGGRELNLHFNDLEKAMGRISGQVPVLAGIPRFKLRGGPRRARRGRRHRRAFHGELRGRQRPSCHRQFTGRTAAIRGGTWRTGEGPGVAVTATATM
jgi:hypothetical protein